MGGLAGPLKLCVFGAAALALASCGPRPADPPADPAPAAQGLANAAPVEAGRIAFTPDGVLGFTARTPFTREGVQAAAPAFDTSEIIAALDGQGVRALDLYLAGEAILRIEADPKGETVSAVSSRSAKAIGPAGLSVGALFSQAPEDLVAFCQPAAMDGGSGFSCSTSVDGVLWLDFKSANPAPGADRPGPGDPLVEMSWIADLDRLSGEP